MYRFPSKQISVTDFGMPLGMKLDQENRWVKKSALIPWDEIELRYAALFKNRKGNVAKPLRLALGALLIQTQYQYSDIEVPMQIQETPCLQYFCGMPAYEDKVPFDSSLMVYFRKRLTPEILGEINEMIISRSKDDADLPNTKDDDDPGMPISTDADDAEPTNEGDLIVDATCAPQNIRYPQDLSLLNEARENLEKMVDIMHDPGDGEKPRTYRRTARRDYLKTARKRQKTHKDVRKAIKKQLQYIRRDLETVAALQEKGNELPTWHQERLSAVRKLYGQQLQMYTSDTHKVEDRIVSLSQPWIRPIVRGKAKAKCEFGAKLDISVSNGLVRPEHTSFDAYNESGNLIEIIERYRKREGHYPERVLADGIYRNRGNLAFCKLKGIRLMGKPLGRPRKDAPFDRKQMRTDEIDRIEVERQLSHAKGSYGLGLIRARLKDTSETAIALSIVALNLHHLEQILRTFFQRLFEWHPFCICYGKIGIVH
jgi:hypothetical protein